MGKISLWKTARVVLVLCAATAIPSAAQTFTTLVNFNGTNGAYPETGLVLGTDGNFYGMTTAGGTSNNCSGGCGTVFKITPPGTLVTLHSFNKTDGAGSTASPITGPTGGLLQATDGNFYGTTPYGANGAGTVFKITPGGTLTTLYNFCSKPNCTDGAVPQAGLVQATDGNFYGTTTGGGTGLPCTAGFCGGTVFKITPGGTLTTLYSFCTQSGCPDGYVPDAVLVQATDGDLYGTTTAGSANGYGTIFKITPGGTLTTLHSFDPFVEGAASYGGLIQGTDGSLYGTASGYGGHHCTGTAYGTVFKITPGGTLTTLHVFCGPDGAAPLAPLLQATDGNFYGTTSTGGTPIYGTVFKITTGGTLTTLHNFVSTDGDEPLSGLLQATDGNFYGTSYSGGANNLGTVFTLGVGLAPFVETRPTSGAVGTTVIILGNNLTGATGVRFNGTAATFSVVSSSEIQTTVPVGATTGIVQVTTPGGTLNSNVPFQVTKTRKRLVQVTSE